MVIKAAAMIDPDFIRYAIAEKESQLALADAETRKRLELEIQGLKRLLGSEE